MLATKLGISPNEVERMYLPRAENLMRHWNEEAEATARAAGGESRPSKPMSAAEIAATFGGRVVSGGGRG